LARSPTDIADDGTLGVILVATTAAAAITTIYVISRRVTLHVRHVTPGS
jgi:hypothetical protein